ncbi:hypothetical protein SISSUDRAFT_158293 [Sistotremastrum suecicum HHB10207 ss-3]|uniref:Secreted protein n=1 Tax=Sistotremastrum suecicum HHB10207 ss-3 TaxID=1314776 RepID=A0A166AQZ2_9AGAM|nr:hypothetical protein SISSUDRAFT_158293 [Sistotremastrum suecicum HHB10207 ss-3]
MGWRLRSWGFGHSNSLCCIVSSLVLPLSSLAVTREGKRANCLHLMKPACSWEHPALKTGWKCGASGVARLAAATF